MQKVFNIYYSIGNRTFQMFRGTPCSTVATFYSNNEDTFLLIILWSMTSAFQIVSLQFEKLLVETSICLHDYVSLLFESFVEIEIEIESRLHCIDIYDDKLKIGVPAELLIKEI